MSGRIKLLDSDGNVINTEGDIPEIKYPYDQQSSFDESCGTYGLEQYQVPNPMCPSHFACLGGGVTSNTDAVSQYVKCYDAINCHMIAGMTTGFTTSDPIALFIYQMIPHHQNAVNMAKNLLLSNAVVCDDLSNPEENEDCTLQAILRGIINSQNYQVQQMRSYLSSNNLPPTDDCNVYMETIDIISSSSRSYSSGSQ